MVCLKLEVGQQLTLFSASFLLSAICFATFSLLASDSLQENEVNQLVSSINQNLQTFKYSQQRYAICIRHERVL